MIHNQPLDIVGLQVAETGTSNAAGGTNYQSTLASPCTSEDCGELQTKDTDHSCQKELPSDSSETDHSSPEEFPSDSYFRYERKAEAMSDTIQHQHQSISSIKESKSMFNVNVDAKAFRSALSESVSKSSREEVKIHFSETRSFNKRREVDSRKEVSEVDSLLADFQFHTNFLSRGSDHVHQRERF